MKANYRKHFVLAAGALAIGCAQAAGWNPETRTYDTTGYWTQRQEGWADPSFSNPSHWKNASGETASAFDANACLYATKFVYAKPDQDKVTSLPCKVLALSETATLGCTGASYFDFGSQVDLLAGASLTMYGAYFKAKGTFNFYSTEEKPNAVKIEAPTTGEDQGYFLYNVTLTGDDKAYVVLGGAKEGCTLANFNWESGDGAAFHGTLRVANFPAAPAACVAQLKLADVTVGGTVSLANNTRLVLTGTSGATVSNLVMDAGSVLVGTTAERKLTVDGKVEKLRIDVSGLSGAADATEWPVVKFSATAETAGFGFGNVVLVNANETMMLCEAELRNDADGGKTLYLVKPAKVATRDTSVASNQYRGENTDNTGYRSELQFAQPSKSAKNFWSDGSCPGDDGVSEVAYSAKATILAFPTNTTAEILQFKGKSLNLNAAGLETSSGTPGYEVSKLRFVAGRCGIRLCDQAGRQIGDVNELGQKYATMRLLGALDLGGSADVTHYVEIYGTRIFLKLESALSGDGNIELQTYPSQNKDALNATLELAGDNVKWTGKLLVKGLNSNEYKNYEIDGQTVSCPNRANANHCRLYLADAAALGGRRANFAHDALELKHYGEVFLRNDVALPAGLNRGVSFGDYATLTVTNGLTFTILQPTTWAGTVYKTGAGKLALGGAAKFGGAEQADTPTAGQNILEVEGGSIEPLTAEAFNGVQIVLADETCRIALNADAKGELADKGLVNVKTDKPFATSAQDGKIRFEVYTSRSESEVASGVTVALCTVTANAASGLRDKFEIGRLKGFRGKVSERQNTDGTTTFLARYVKWGFAISIR